jgi:phosphate transport system substrate-binding protein
VDGLTLLQLRSIFAGWTLNWSEIGGDERDLLIVSREDGSGTRASFEEQVMGDQPVTLTAIVMPSSPAVTEYVAGHRGAIGYVSMSAAAAIGAGHSGSAATGPTGPLKVLRIEGAYPAPSTVETGIYHLTRPLYLASQIEPSAEVRAFIDFVLSSAGQDIVGQRFGRVR